MKRNVCKASVKWTKRRNSFLAAFKKAQETEENCEDIPEDNDLGVWTDNIAKSIEDLGYVVKGDRIVRKKKTPEDDGGKQSEKSSAEFSRFYVALSGGAGSYGTYSIGEIKSGGTAVLGIDVAYFFNRNIGAGLKLNREFCDIDTGSSIANNETMTFFGPALYLRWGKDKLALTAGAGIGILGWQCTISNLETSIDASVGAFLSAGANYMLTQNFGIGLNVQSVFGSLNDQYGNKRNPAGIGATLGFNFRF